MLCEKENCFISCRSVVVQQIVKGVDRSATLEGRKSPRLSVIPVYSPSFPVVTQELAEVCNLYVCTVRPKISTRTKSSFVNM